MTNKARLDTQVRYLKGVGPKKAKLFGKIGINTVEDLCYYFPRRYEDRSNFLPVSKLQEEKFQTISATVLAKSQRQSWKRRGFSILKVAVGDSTGKLFCVWFNQPYLKNYFEVGQRLVLYGKVQRYSGRLQINSPEFEIIYEEKTDPVDIGGITPIYTLPEGMTQRYFRRILKRVLQDYLPGVVDTLPYDIRERNNLLNLARSLIGIHFPSDLNHSKEAYRRLAFEEFFLFQIPLFLRKLKKKQCPGLVHKVEGRMSDGFLEKLPFELTPAQIRVINEIKQDMARPLPMNRLLQGDVGSGKTIVAVFASVCAIQSGYQAAFMVPTELLAQQHYQNCRDLLNGVNIALLIGSLTKAEKSGLYKKIEEGKFQLIIGTHSLLEEKLRFKRLGLVIIDEQHKFGVSQRAYLPRKGENPDVLIMTATPIPRTLAITIYGDLDISVIDELPPLRKPVKTKFAAPDKRKEVYSFIAEKISQGRQAYIIYSVIEESGVSAVQAANRMYEVFKKEIFPNLKIALVHGQLNTKQQHRIMSEFRDGKIDILVATTVLEVGIDVPNASIMLIENAERFGLSQLHQLRGRIGRGEHESYCILISQLQTEEARLRVKVMIDNSDGFRIAEEDLKIRGPGEFFGQRQHGLSELKIANPLTQFQLLRLAREEAGHLVDSDPELKLKQNSAMREKISRRFPGYESYETIG
ncbi:MAG: ATP-dependent DNA helicase RecG [Candidatus Omnitrophota bacterium]